MIGRWEVVHPGLAGAFRGLTDAGITWALLRGAEDLARPCGDVDLLVQPTMPDRLDEVLAAVGMRRMGMRGHGSHRFYFTYDAESGGWLKLDVVTQVDFGARQALGSPLAGPLLERRRPDGLVWRLAVEDEAWLFLLHLVLDKQQIAEGRRQAAHDAARWATSDSPVAAFLEELAPGTPGRLLDVAERKDVGAVEELAGFLARRWAAQHGLGVRWTSFKNRAARRLELPVDRRASRLVVALVGPDGAGKTTLSESLSNDFPVPVRSVYMGLWRSSRWDGLVSRVPGGAVLQRTTRILRSGLAVRRHRRRGRLVLLDRFPQDALLTDSLDSSRGRRLVRFLSLRLPPLADLVLLLDAPGELMFARKGELSPVLLEDRRQAYLRLVRQFPHAAVIDATRPVDEVHRTALTAIWGRLQQPDGQVPPHSGHRHTAEDGAA